MFSYTNTYDCSNQNKQYLMLLLTTKGMIVHKYNNKSILPIEAWGILPRSLMKGDIFLGATEVMVCANQWATTPHNDVPGCHNDPVYTVAACARGHMYFLWCREWVNEKVVWTRALRTKRGSFVSFSWIFKLYILQAVTCIFSYALCNLDPEK